MKLGKIFAGIVGGAALIAASSVAPVMAAGDICSDMSFTEAQREAAGCGTSTTVSEVANSIIEVIIGVVGLLAVGIVLYGGVSYTISTGDAAKAMKARRAIMYGLIGLAISLLAFAIVRFVPKLL